MNGRYDFQEQVPSSSGHGTYTVSRVAVGGQWECSCIGWTRTVPRKDCKHIRLVKVRLNNKPRDLSSLSGAALRTMRKVTDPAPSAKAVLAPWTPSKADHVHPPANLSVLQRVTPRTAEEQASDARIDAALAARVKREGVAAKKLTALRQLRYGFQLAHPYEPEDLNRGEWVAEVKYDGDLAMLIDGRIINRSGNDVTHRFPEIDTTAWDGGVVLVGELVVIENGLSVFKRIQERATDDPIKILAASKQHPARFMAFDMLEFNGAPLDGLAARVRRAQMEQWFHDFGEDLAQAGIDLVEQLPVSTPGEVEALVDACRKLETEGIMLKNLDAPYVAQRGRNWVKAKAWLEEEFEVVRYEDTGVGGGWVFYIQSGAHEQRIVCNSAAMKKAIIAGHERYLDGLRRSPLDWTPQVNAPRVKVEVKYLSKGADGALRFPSLRRLV